MHRIGCYFIVQLIYVPCHSHRLHPREILDNLNIAILQVFNFFDTYHTVVSEAALKSHGHSLLHLSNFYGFVHLGSRPRPIFLPEQYAACRIRTLR